MVALPGSPSLAGALTFSQSGHAFTPAISTAGKRLAIGTYVTVTNDSGPAVLKISGVSYSLTRP